MMRRLRVVCVAAALVVAAASLAPTHAQRPTRARLSADLLARRDRPSGAPVRVIVHGLPADVASLAARYGGRVRRWLQDGAALEVPEAALDALAAEPGQDHLSGDVLVGSAMKISNLATAADQARAGSSGYYIVWGTEIQDANGQYFVWGNGGVAPDPMR